MSNLRKALEDMVIHAEMGWEMEDVLSAANKALAEPDTSKEDFLEAIRAMATRIKNQRKALKDLHRQQKAADVVIRRIMIENAELSERLKP